MILTYKGRKYKLQFRKKFFPFAVKEIVTTLHGEPQDYPLRINGDKLLGKVALVTGAHKGIGLHIALRLLKDGCKVIITGRNEQQIKNTLARVNTPNLVGFVWDISDEHTGQHFQEAEKFFGGIDILVNNAGVNKINGTSMPLETASRDYIHSMMDINVLATIRMCEAFVSKNSEGTILNVVSNTAVRPATGIYWMSKWALYSFTKAFSRNLYTQRSNVTINGICPGPTKTDMMFGALSSMYSSAMSNRRMGYPEEIAELAFVQICSGLNGQSGEITICDGGESLN